MKTLIRAALLLAGAALAVLIGFGFLAPTLALADSAAQFRLHFGVVLIGTSVLLLALGPWRLLALGLRLGLMAVGLAGLVSALVETGGFTPLDEAPDGTRLRLYSFNLLGTRIETDDVRAQISETRPDIIVLLEVSARNQHIIQSLSDRFSLVFACNTGRWGIAILVRPGIRRTGSFDCVPYRSFGWIGLRIGDQPLAVAGVHLHWPAPFGQLRYLAEMEPRLARVPRPVLVAGDFNALPWGQAVRRVEEATDTTVIPGYRATWPAHWLPSWLMDRVGLAIDHVLVPHEVAVVSIRALEPAGSDHRALLTDLVFP